MSDWRAPSPPEWTNGWGRYIQASVEGLRWALERETLAMRQEIRNEIAHLLRMVEDHETRLRATEHPEEKSWLIEELRPHKSRIVALVLLCIASRVATGTWPDPVAIAEKLIGVGGG